MGGISKIAYMYIKNPEFYSAIAISEFEASYTTRTKLPCTMETKKATTVVELISFCSIQYFNLE